MIDYISTAEAPKPVGPYSQAVKINIDVMHAMIITSGQVAIDPKTGKFLHGDIATQTTQVCENLKAVLKKGGSDFSHVLKSTVFLADMKDFVPMNTIYEKYFGKPARSAIGVNELPLGAKVEIEVIAYA
ncbi:MAG: hypothetical protein HY445_03370 [Candidatus Niyogibacteria bacterium]|nr:hypothetical protein [Candidatus Niyogibacteria bacterium]